MAKHQVFWNEDGVLTEAGIWAATKRIREELKPVCSVCGSTEWAVGECLVGLPAIPDLEGGFPVVAVTCRGCGNTITFHASGFFGMPVEAGVLTRWKIV